VARDATNLLETVSNRNFGSKRVWVIHKINKHLQSKHYMFQVRGIDYVCINCVALPCAMVRMSPMFKVHYGHMPERLFQNRNSQSIQSSKAEDKDNSGDARNLGLPFQYEVKLTAGKK
jgi:hypothetical protein